MKKCYWCGTTNDMEDRQYFCSTACGLYFAMAFLDDNSAYFCERCEEWHLNDECPDKWDQDFVVLTDPNWKDTTSEV